MAVINSCRNINYNPRFCTPCDANTNVLHPEIMEGIQVSAKCLLLNCSVQLLDSVPRKPENIG